MIRFDMVVLTALAIGGIAAFAPASAQAGARRFRPIRVNCGGRKFVDADKVTWRGDRRHVGGRRVSSSIDIVGTDDDRLYGTSREGDFRYGFRVPRGTYAVRLRFADARYGAAGARSFDVRVEGQNVLDDMDLVASVGTGQPLDVVKVVDVNDGRLRVDFTSERGGATVSAIEVVRVASGDTPSRLAAGVGVVDLGMVVLGERGDYVPVTLSNAGAKPLRISSARIAGPDAGAFELSDGGARTVAAGGTAELRVRFRPRSARGHAAALHVFSDSAGGVLRVPIRGSGVLELRAGAGASGMLDFGGVRLGRTSGRQMVCVDSGEITSIRVDGPDRASFTASGIASPGVGNGGLEAVGVTFTPADMGGHDASLVLKVAAVETEFVVPLAGEGDGGFMDDVRINAGGGTYTDSQGAAWLADVDFVGGTPYGDDGSIAGTADDSLYQTERYGDFEYVLPTGSGTFDVTFHFAEIYWGTSGSRIFDVLLEGATVIDDLDIVAVAGGSTAYSVTRTVAVLDGNLTASFSTELDNAKLSALHVVQVGGASGSGDLSVSPASVDFPNTEPGAASTPVTVTVTNQGAEARTVSSVLLEGAQALDFAHTASPPYALGPGASVTFDVVFTPVEEGARSALLELVDDDPAADVLVPLTGTGDTGSGHGFMHAVAGAPQTVADGDQDGQETVTLNGAGSHTHEFGVGLASWIWRENGQVIASGETPEVAFGVGVHTVELTLTDELGKTDTDTTTVEVVDPQRVPGLLAYYYEGLTNPTQLPNFSNLTPTFGEVVADVNVPSNSTALGGAPTITDIGARYVGILEVPVSGTYRLRITSDDGSALYVNGKRVVNNDGVHAMLAKTARVQLTKGLVPIELRYFNADAPAGIILRWRPPNGTMQVIPAANLFHAEVGAQPVLATADPRLSAPSGGQPVTITGLGFLDDPVSVDFGGVSVPSSSFTSRTFDRIVVPSPAGSGVVNLSVTTSQGTTRGVSFSYSEDAALPVSFSVGQLASVQQPTTLAFGPDGRLYVATVAGVIKAFTLGVDGDVVATDTYDAIQALGEGRVILGIAFNPADVSGQPAIYVANTKLFSPELYPGKVSLLRGPSFDTVEDLVTGLPVSDHDHGNNGMEFGPLGELFLTVGGNTNAGVPDSALGLRDESVLSAAILRANIHMGGFDGAVTYDQTTNPMTANQVGGFGVEVFAPGLRNPYDLVLHTNGKLYATDNGPNGGFGQASIGCGLEAPDPQTPDELVVVRQGDYYGHPNRNRGRSDSRQCIYRSADEAPGTGFTQAMHLLPSSSNGVCEYTANTFGGSLRGQLLIVQFNQDLRAYELSADGEGVVDDTLLGEGGLDVTQGPDGSVYVADYGGDKVIRYTPVVPDPSAFSLRDTFPNRGSVVGGSPLRVTGTGFGAIGGTTVTVGGQSMTLTSVTATEIVGFLPAGAAAGPVDVVVTTGGSTKILAHGFRYIGGSTGTPGGTWEGGPSMGTAVGECSVAVADGKVFVLGGGSSLVQTYDIDAAEWVTTTAALPSTFDGSDHVGMATVGGKVYAIGGLAPPSSDVHVYDPTSNTWTLETQIQYQGQDYAFGSQAIGVVGTKIYIAGGLEDESDPVGTAMVYDTLTGNWSDLPAMPTALNHAAGVGHAGKLWVFGGRPGVDFPHGGSDLVQVYDPGTDSWDTTTYTLPTARAATGNAVVLNGRILVLGGEGGGPANGLFPHVEELEPVTNTWRRLADMPTPRHGTMPVVWDHHVYVAGGGIVEGFSESKILEVLHAEGTGDALAPSVTVAQAPGQAFQHAPTLTVSLADDVQLDDATWRFDDAPVHAWLTDIGQAALFGQTLELDDTEFHDLPDGPHVLRIEATDTSGNVGVRNWSFVKGDPPPVVVRVNCGGGAHTDALSQLWLADQGSSGGSTYSTGAAISGTAEDALYQSERWGQFTYGFAVPNGTYTVKLHFAEIYSGTFENGARVFAVDMEGSRVLTDLDIHSEVGPEAALVKTLQVTVTDGTLNIATVPKHENPKLSAIEIY